VYCADVQEYELGRGRHIEHSFHGQLEGDRGWMKRLTILTFILMNTGK